MAPSRERRLASWFAFLGRAFLSADPADLRRLIADMRRRVPDDAGDERTLEQMDKALRGDVEELEKEYVRLFLNPGGAPCPPWQSAHAEEPQLLGPAHRSALAWFRAAGVEPKNPAEPADHVGLLLAFYASLLQTGNPADIAAAFYEEHLGWIGSFSRLVAIEAQHPFYRFLADATQALLEQARPRAD